MNGQDPKTKFAAPGKDEPPQEYPALESKMITKPVYDKSVHHDLKRLEGKVALITGGDSGIGRSVAVTFAREGASIMISYLPEEEGDAQETCQVIKSNGGKAAMMAGDLSDHDFCDELIEEVLQEFSKIDIVVNNAGLQKYFKNLDEITAKDFENIYQVNVVAPFLISQAAAKHMQPGSSIINTVSIEAYDPDFLLLPYATSKGALVALTKGLSEELIKKGIRVNAVAPGPVWSPLNTHGSPPAKLQKFGENSAFERPAQPIELAPVYVLLASDEASYITGEVYGVTGGEGIA